MGATLFSNFLKALGVPHTEDYSSRRFAGMTFKSIFGLTKLLQSYGIDSETLRFADKSAGYEALPVPFLAQFDGCFAIVTGKDSGGVAYSSPDAPGGSNMPATEFLDKWTGVALVAYPTAESSEPDLEAHRVSDAVKRVLPWAGLLAGAVLVTGLAYYGGLLRQASTATLVVLNLFGACISMMLVQKSSGYHTASADRLCSVIERTGCNTVLSTAAAKLLGAVGWSAVGLGYFTVNVAAVLLAPESIHAMALLNVCCLPFSFWSIWYQHWRAHAWCTMCLLVQATLWLIFAVNLLGGFLVWPPVWEQLIFLVAGYVAFTVGINALSEEFSKIYNKSDTSAL